MGYVPRHTFGSGGRVSTQQRNQVLIAAALLVPGTLALRNPRNVLRAWKFGAATIEQWTELAGALPALGSSHKFGVRFGGAGMTTIGETYLGNMYMGGTPEAGLPIPTFGFGITAVPNTSSRWVYERNKKSLSRGGSIRLLAD